MIYYLPNTFHEIKNKPYMQTAREFVRRSNLENIDFCQGIDENEYVFFLLKIKTWFKVVPCEVTGSKFLGTQKIKDNNYPDFSDSMEFRSIRTCLEFDPNFTL